jgi:hypothetical protein
MSYDRQQRSARSSQSRHGLLSHWIPLALTVTVATVGVVAWIWSERKEDEDDHLPPPPGGYGDNVYPRPGPPDPQLGLQNPVGGIPSGPPSYADVRPGEVAYGTVPVTRPEENQSYVARMSGALRRTPSPQQVFDGVSRSVTGGIAAAGAVVGTALGSIMEEDKTAYKDHKTWSEEAEARALGTSPAAGPSAGIEMRSDSTPGVSSQRVPQAGGKRKTVAIVLSADSDGDMDGDEGEFQEHAVSIGSYCLESC